MSGTTREVVEALYAALGSGDAPATLELMDPEIDWTEAAGFVYGGTYHGPQAVLEGVFARIGSEWDGFDAAGDRLVVEGDRAIATGTYSGTYKATGRSFSARFAHAFEVRDGKIVRFEQIVDSAELNKAL